MISKYAFLVSLLSYSQVDKLFAIFKVPKKIIMLFVFVCALLCVDSLIATDTSLCSNDFSKHKCMCKRFTDEKTGHPSSIADCTGLALNKFPDIHDLPDDITVLDLSVNYINLLDPSVANVSSQTVRKLVVSYNTINYVSIRFFEGLPELVVLDMSHNNITSLEDGSMFLRQKKLLYLDLTFNNIKQLPEAIFDPLVLLQHLYLSYNPLGNFLMESKDVLSRTLGVAPNITHLAMNNNGLYDLYADYFEPFKNLKHLELADNNFTLIPPLPYSVEYLDFSGNNLSFVSAKYLNYHSLKFLRLSRMPSLTSIHHYAFYNLQSLETLIITDCPNINNFTELAFGLASKTTNIHPKKLVLARNGIRSLNSTYKHMFRFMEHVDLRHNPWDCDCDILWLQEFDVELFKGGEIRCATPRILKNKSVMKLIHIDLQQCFPEIYGKTSHRVLIVVLMTCVVFLVGLVYYLIRYPKSWVNPKNFIISPTSPYSPASQDDRYRH